MKWQVGNLISFKDDDPEFDTYQSALDAAESLSHGEWESFFGVWTSQEEGGELVAIYHAGVGYFS